MDMGNGCLHGGDGGDNGLAGGDVMKLVRKQFRTWLDAQAPRKVVGIAGDSCDCPLAVYLTSLGARNARVYPDKKPELRSGTFYLDRMNASRRRLPKWANAFAVSVDGYLGHITAKRALAILDDG